jgi:hypothetical protein
MRYSEEGRIAYMYLMSLLSALTVDVSRKNAYHVVGKFLAEC